MTSSPSGQSEASWYLWRLHRSGALLGVSKVSSCWKRLNVGQSALQGGETVTLLTNQEAGKTTGSWSINKQEMVLNLMAGHRRSVAKSQKKTCQRSDRLLAVSMTTTRLSWMNSSRAAHSDSSWGHWQRSATKDRMGSRSSAPLRGQRGAETVRRRY